ncbi:hypothetical protein [Marivita sp. GX14005]|uniref:hypothetical protein n=1 Tax=Marivita sp. GX14005 TaxID=2942276 RepID=UPI002019F32C|nr:hypothetical protein [Marivita sp. GX14005]MCL3883293.1 hypothetical protein [Marivita sp. GX14005]
MASASPTGPVPRAAAALRAALGLGAPAEAVSASYTLEANGIEIEIVAAPDGRDALMTARLGWLDPDPRRAEDQVTRLLRIGLALPSVNRAALTVLGSDASVADRSARLADIALGKGRPTALGAIRRFDPAQAGEALRDLLHWAGQSDGVLAGAAMMAQGVPSQPPARPATDPDEMMIFRP